MVDAPYEVWVPAAPNNYAGGGHQKDSFILHWMGGYLPGTDRMFQNPATGYCTNYGIGSRDGKGDGLEVHRYTPDDSYRAFGSYNDDADDRGLSVEIENAYPNPSGTPTYAVHELVATFMAAKADALRLGPLVLGDFSDHRFYERPIPGLGSEFNVTTHRSMAWKDCPGTTDVQLITRLANEMRPGTPSHDPALARRQEENIMYTRGATFGDVYASFTDANGEFRLRACGPAEAAYAAAGGLVIFGDDLTLTRLGVEGQYTLPVVPDIDVNVALTDTQIKAIAAQVAAQVSGATPDQVEAIVKANVPIRCGDTPSMQHGRAAGDNLAHPARAQIPRQSAPDTTAN